jgi:hypothetical protein
MRIIQIPYAEPGVGSRTHTMKRGKATGGSWLNHFFWMRGAASGVTPRRKPGTSEGTLRDFWTIRARASSSATLS